MKRIVSLALASLFLPLLVACRGTLEIGLEKTPSPQSEFTLGLLAYVQGGDIWVRDLDSPNSEPRRLTTDGRNSSPRWSPSGQWLAFRKGDYQVWLMRGDGTDAYALNDGRTVGAFAWAPREDRLAYVWGEEELQAINADGTDQAVLVLQSPFGRIGRIAWSPDGTWIAYEWREQQPKGPITSEGLCKVSANGDKRVKLYEGAATLAGWTGDSGFVLFWEGSIFASASLMADGVPLSALPAGGGSPVRLAESVLAYSDFVAPASTGTAQIAVIVGSYRAAWMAKSLHILSASTREDLVLTTADMAASSPVWSPDGQRIAYVAMPDQGDLVGGEPARQGLMQRRLWVAKVNGEPQAQQLTDDPSYRDECPAWSADGSHILFVRLNAKNQASLWLIPVQDGEPQQVVKELTPTPEWFGYYGHINWDGLFDWWTGLRQVSERPITLPTHASTPTPPTSTELGLLYLQNGVLFKYDGNGEHLLARLPEDVGHLTLGPYYLAYVQGSQIKTLSLADGTAYTLLDLGQRPGQDFSLRWSNDGSVLAYAVAWDDPDGSRKVELGTTDGYEHRVVDTLIAQPAGARPTLTPTLPMPTEIGFANLHVLGFNRTNGRLAVTQVGGGERYSTVWFYDSRTGRRVETRPLAMDAQEVNLSPDMTWLAVARAGVLQVYPLGTNAPPVEIELPAGTHARWLAWSPSGQQLIYLLHEGIIPSLDVSPSLSLWVWEAQIGQSHQLAPAVSPEGTLYGWTTDEKAAVLEMLNGISRKRMLSLVDVATGQTTSLLLPEGSQIVGWIGNADTLTSTDCDV